MNRTFLSFLLAAMTFFGFAVSAQTPTGNTDILGAHDLGSGMGGVTGPNTNACIYCHVPHRSVTKTPLWNQTLSTQTYTLYTSGTEQNIAAQPTIGKTSVLCLSCHDGTVAPGQTAAYGSIKVTGAMSDIFGSKLEGSHPFSLQTPLKDAANLAASLTATQTTKDPAVQLIAGNVECNSCHNVHNQSIDPRNRNFLVRDNTGSAICLACHETASRTVNGVANQLQLWTNSAHALAANEVAPKAGLGGYTTMAEYACSSCHVSHNATGAGLLRKNLNRPANTDDSSQNCYICHDGSNNLTQPILNVLADFQKIGHPYADSNNVHTLGEPIVLDRNRHTTCADCHNSHAAQATTSFPGVPALRPSQLGVTGVASDGSLLNQATNQFENCLRCHGSSINKQTLSKYGYLPARGLFTGDLLNVLLQFNSTLSRHPVMQDATNINQPSLLKSMWDIYGKSQLRSMGTRILCSDCHNSDANREFGGQGPNGPHGSKFDHILERKYSISQVNPGVFPAAGPGSPIINLTPTPTLDPVTSPFALCAKCHDLNNVNSNASFFNHSGHLTAGVSCSACHSAHGVPNGTSGVTGARLVTFDLNVVAPYKGTISYDNKGNCTLICHMWDHNGAAKPKPH